jgi:hypothetical protein
MGLSLAGKLVDFYGEAGLETAKQIFKELLRAPWMSSGLAENNAFTTILVLRLFGMFVGADVLYGGEGPAEPVKLWELQIEFTDFDTAATKLVSQELRLAKHLFELFPPALQDRLRRHVAKGIACKKTQEKVVTEIEKLIRTGNLCQADLVSNLAPTPGIEALESRRTGEYTVPQLNRLYLHQLFANEVRPLEKFSLADIAREMCRTAGEPGPNIDRFKINNYEPSTAVLYWFADGMLPKLAKLHDRRRIVLLMATNFQANFDDVIKRPGRFDVLLCMGPPMLTDKCNSIHRFLRQKADDNTKLVGNTIENLARLDTDGWVEDQLSLYTYGDFKSFVEKI